MILLFAWFMVSSAQFLPLRYYIAAALSFSWMGDVFLLVRSAAPGWFMAGLASFLVAHILYILFFVQVRRKQTAAANWNWAVITTVAIYTTSLIVFLLPFVGSLKGPVIVYAVTIATMLLMAVHAFGSTAGKAGWYCIAGAILFLCSDSLLALNKFYRVLPAADWLIMLTYGLAQFGIAKGSLLYLAGEKSVAA